MCFEILFTALIHVPKADLDCFVTDPIVSPLLFVKWHAMQVTYITGKEIQRLRRVTTGLILLLLSCRRPCIMSVHSAHFPKVELSNIVDRTTNIVPWLLFIWLTTWFHSHWNRHILDRIGRPIWTIRSQRSTQCKLTNSELPLTSLSPYLTINEAISANPPLERRADWRTMTKLTFLMRPG